MANKLAKTRPVDKPYAIYEANGIKWHILKTYKQASSEAKDPYARWFTVGYSAATGPLGDMGDTYIKEIKHYGRLTWASPEFKEAYNI